MLQSLLQILLKLPKNEIQRTADTTGDLIGNKIADAVTTSYGDNKNSKGFKNFTTEYLRDRRYRIQW